MARLLTSLLVLLLTPALSSAWSSQGHQAVAETAQARLTPTAQTALARILQGTNVLVPCALATIATWPDARRDQLSRQETV